jgi:hypothetical protein
LGEIRKGTTNNCAFMVYIVGTAQNNRTLAHGTEEMFPTEPNAVV